MCALYYYMIHSCQSLGHKDDVPLQGFCFWNMSQWNEIPFLFWLVGFGWTISKLPRLFVCKNEIYWKHCNFKCDISFNIEWFLVCHYSWGLVTFNFFFLKYYCHLAMQLLHKIHSFSKTISLFICNIIASVYLSFFIFLLFLDK